MSAAILAAIAACARDWRWHVYCATCQSCVGHGTLSGAIETAPQPGICSSCGTFGVVIDTEAAQSGLTATYSPDDNKLRLYSVHRLEAETYARVYAAGFRWAPKQELFVAPKWTPQREDLLIELCGEISDEDMSLTERAEGRAERFEAYSEHRASDAEGARKAVDRIASGIPFGQPILVGHHSERHARRDAEKIENGMRRSIKMWEQSKYWTDRAEGAISHAKYKELPAVRARRIKGIEADKRKAEKESAQWAKWLATWSVEGMTPEAARHLANYSRLNVVKREGNGWWWSAYDVLSPDGERFTACQSWTVEQVQEAARRAYPRSIARNARWITHYDNRLAYERTMLAASGWVAPEKPKTKASLPLLNYAGTVSYRNPWRNDEVVTQEAVPVTKAQLAAIYTDYKGTRVSACGTHRVRTAMHVPGQGRDLCIVYLSDSKQRARPGAEVVQAKATEEGVTAGKRAEAKRTKTIARIEAREQAQEQNTEHDAKDAEFRAMKESLRGGIVVVSAPQLFPTPPDLAQRMVALAEIEPGHLVMEPSVGTGNIVREIIATVDTEIVGYEINARLTNVAASTFPPYRLQVRCRDFLEVTDGYGGFDRIIMNPPFANGADVAHIQHARKFLKSGGRIVALCANGPRQRAALMPLGRWEELPEGSFKEAGTNVNVALLVIEA